MWLHQFYYQEMAEQNGTYTFNNLEPLAFLRKFNKMIEEDERYTTSQPAKEQRIFGLTKFPLPKFYYNMEGIFETGVKEKVLNKAKSKKKDDEKEEQFLKQHNKFMIKTIDKIIKDNDQHQLALHKQKEYYEQGNKTGESKHTRSKSEPKRILKLKSISRNNAPSQNTQVQSRVDVNQVEVEEDKPVSYLQALQHERGASFQSSNKQKLSLKKGKKLSDFLQERRGSMSARQIGQFKDSSVPARIEYNKMSPIDWQKRFVQDLFDIQKQQSEYQTKYSKRVDEEIRKFNDQVKLSVDKIKSKKYW